MARALSRKEFAQLEALLRAERARVANEDHFGTLSLPSHHPVPRDRRRDWTLPGTRPGPAEADGASARSGRASAGMDLGLG
jgi:hypothetical protein